MKLHELTPLAATMSIPFGRARLLQLGVGDHHHHQLSSSGTDVGDTLKKFLKIRLSGLTMLAPAFSMV